MYFSSAGASATSTCLGAPGNLFKFQTCRLHWQLFCSSYLWNLVSWIAARCIFNPHQFSHLVDTMAPQTVLLAQWDGSRWFVAKFSNVLAILILDL